MRESNGKPAKTSVDKTVKFITQLYDNFSQLLPHQRRQKCLLVSSILQAHRIIGVALHHGVFRGIVKSLEKHYSKVFRKL